MRAWAAIVLAGLWATACPALAGPPETLPVSPLVVETAHGPVRFHVELARDEASQERGLMFRKTLAPNAGMLFDCHRPTMVTFWMKNTILPLDMIFIRADGTISSIHADAVPETTRLIPSTEPVRAVLEINGGRAEALGIAPDDRVRHAIFGDMLARPQAVRR
jgi:uncharacterized membrane protein (UPF0127 family)